MLTCAVEGLHVSDLLPRSDDNTLCGSASGGQLVHDLAKDGEIKQAVLPPEASCGGREEEKTKERPDAATDAVNNLCHKLMTTMQDLAVADQWQQLVHILSRAPAVQDPASTITTEELKMCLSLAKRSADIGKQKALRQVVQTGDQLGINESEANSERQGHMRIMAFLFETVRN